MNQDYREPRISITNLEHQYAFVSQKAAEQSGYPDPDKMLGTTVFDLKTPVVKIAEFVHKINVEVINTLEQVSSFDIARYDMGLAAFITHKKPYCDSNNQLVGLLTEGHVLNENDLSPFINDLFCQAKRLDRLDKLGSIAYRIVEDYAKHGLSKAESKVMFLLAHGKTLGQAGEILARSSRTIEGHTDHMKEKLNLRTKGDLIEYAIYTGLNGLIPRGLLV